MRRIYYIVVFIMFSSVVVNAQHCNHSKKRRQIEAQKVTYITQQLDLSPVEAQQFWPVYNEMQKKRQELHTEMRKIHRSCRKSEVKKCSDADVSAKCDSILMCEKKQIDIKIEYFGRFKKILPPQKVHKLMFIESDFNNKLMKRLGKRRGSGKKF